MTATFPPWEQRQRDAETVAITDCDVHGHRIETRRLTATTALRDYLDWPHAAQVVRIERSREIDGETQHDAAYAITSLPPSRASAERLLALDRGHWGIENRLHYVRDVTLGEDASRVRSGHAPRVYAMLRCAVLALLRNGFAGFRNNVAAALRSLSWNPTAALALVAQPITKN